MWNSQWAEAVQVVFPWETEQRGPVELWGQPFPFTWVQVVGPCDPRTGAFDVTEKARVEMEVKKTQNATFELSYYILAPIGNECRSIFFLLQHYWDLTLLVWRLSCLSHQLVPWDLPIWDYICRECRGEVIGLTHSNEVATWLGVDW